MTAIDPSYPLPSFEPPGPGHWALDAMHFPRPLTRYFQQIQAPAFQRGSHEFALFYGLLIDGLQMAYVNGFGYNQIVQAPKAELPARFARAEQVFADKLWREQLREWDETCKPAAIVLHRELQAIDPQALSDTDLAAYLTRCRDHHAAMILQHMRFTAAALLPTGDFLAHAAEWTGLAHSELLGLLRGSAEVSAGGSDELDVLKSAFAEGSPAREVLASDGDPADVLAATGNPAKVLERLRVMPGIAGKAVNSYFDLVGYRIVDGFDISEPSALEMPDVLLRAINVAVFDDEQAESDVQQRIAAVREQVPAPHQNSFDELLDEARLTYRLRDERGVYSDIWAAGLMRRATLAAGQRLADKGRIARADHLLDADLDEMCALLAGNKGPGADELAARAAYRARYGAKDVPATLGAPAPQTPDLSGLPPSVARVMRAFFIAIDHMFGSSKAQHAGKLVYGLAASKGVYEGPARRISSPAEFDRIAKGDVLVTESTSEAFNILLPLLGAIVTDNGGLLSHAAIVAREYGIPGVVGTREATTRIQDGQRIRVDGDNGEVTVLA